MLAPGEEPYLPDPSAFQGPDPFDTPELRRIFQSPTNYPHLAFDSTKQRVQTANTAEADPFDQFPTEILSCILTYLPSGDVVRMKQASRVFANIVLPDSFWKSRFVPGRELDYIVEARQYFSSHAHKGRWGSIFSILKILKRCHPAVANRTRVWDLCLSLHGLLELMRDTNCDGTPAQSLLELNALPLDDRHWVTASRYLKSPNQHFNRGSRVLYERMMMFPSRATAIFVSTIELFGRRYISGLRILNISDEAFSLGYRHSNSEKLLVSRENGPVRITGFCLAHDQRGVRGLSVIDDTGTQSDWIGDYQDIPKRKLLPTPGGFDVIDRLKGGFDVSDFDRPPPPLLLQAMSLRGRHS